MASEIPPDLVEEMHKKTEEKRAEASETGEKLPIRRDMSIAEATQLYPETAEVLMENGVGCVGCGAAFFETIEQGLAGHGMPEEQIDSIVADMNKMVQLQKGE